MGVENSGQQALPPGNIEAIRGVFNVTDDGLIRVTTPAGERFRLSRQTLAVGFKFDDAMERRIRGTNVIFVVAWEDEAHTQGPRVLYFDQTRPHFRSETVQ